MGQNTGFETQYLTRPFNHEKAPLLARHEAPRVAASTRRSLRLPLLSRAIAVAQNARRGVSPHMPPAHQITRKNRSGISSAAQLEHPDSRHPWGCVPVTRLRGLAQEFGRFCNSGGAQWEVSGGLLFFWMEKREQQHSAGHKWHRLRLRSGKCLGTRRDPRDFRSSHPGMLPIPESRGVLADSESSGVCEISISRLVKSQFLCLHYRSFF